MSRGVRQVRTIEGGAIQREHRTVAVDDVLPRPLNDVVAAIGDRVDVVPETAAGRPERGTVVSFDDGMYRRILSSASFF